MRTTGGYLLHSHLMMGRCFVPATTPSRAGVEPGGEWHVPPPEPRGAGGAMQIGISHVSCEQGVSGVNTRVVTPLATSSMCNGALLCELNNFLSIHCTLL